MQPLAPTLQTQMTFRSLLFQHTEQDSNTTEADQRRCNLSSASTDWSMFREAATYNDVHFAVDDDIVCNWLYREVHR